MDNTFKLSTPTLFDTQKDSDYSDNVYWRTPVLDLIEIQDLCANSTVAGNANDSTVESTPGDVKVPYKSRTVVKRDNESDLDFRQYFILPNGAVVSDIASSVIMRELQNSKEREHQGPPEIASIGNTTIDFSVPNLLESDFWTPPTIGTASTLPVSPKCIPAVSAIPNQQVPFVAKQQLNNRAGFDRALSLGSVGHSINSGRTITIPNFEERSIPPIKCNNNSISQQITTCTPKVISESDKLYIMKPIQIAEQAVSAKQHGKTEQKESEASTQTLFEKTLPNSSYRDSLKGPRRQEEAMVAKSRFSGRSETKEIEDSCDKNNRKKWFRYFQLARAFVVFFISMRTYVPALSDPIVEEMNGKPLIITVIVFACLDVLIQIVKAWPDHLWFCWDTKIVDTVCFCLSRWIILIIYGP
jgi:hypothetical protein